MFIRASLVVFLLPLLACTTQLPGEVDVGLFDFLASTALVEAECKPEMSDESSFQFEGRFRLEANLSDGYFIYRNIHRTAQFDGQNMVSVYVAERSFVNECKACNLSVVETLNVVLLSKTQNELLKGQCPGNAFSESMLVNEDENVSFAVSASERFHMTHACNVALREGVPVVDEQDVFPPGPVSHGFDAVRACGTLIAHVVTTSLSEQEGCPEDCYKEDIVYYIEGIRRE